jgi:hypothetical protein
MRVKNPQSNWIAAFATVVPNGTGLRGHCAVLLLGLFACATNAETSRMRPTPRPAWQRSCTEYARAPVNIRFEDAPGGAAVVYRSQGNAAALRRRTREVAAFHNSEASKVEALQELFEIPHWAYVEDVNGGAKLILVPKDALPHLLVALRLEVQQETLMLRRHGCGTGPEAL